MNGAQINRKDKQDLVFQYIKFTWIPIFLAGEHNKFPYKIICNSSLRCLGGILIDLAYQNVYT